MWRSRWGLAAGLLLALLSACQPPSDRGPDTSAAPAAASGATPAGARPLEPVKVTVPTKSLTFLPFYFGQDKGLFREEGVDLDLIQMRPPLGIAALEAGDVAYSAAPGVGMRAALQGAALRVILFAQTRPSFSLIGQPGMVGEKVQTVAVSGLRSTAHYAALAVMRRLGRGGPQDEVTYLTTNETAQSYTALTAGAVDAAILSPPYTAMALLAGYVNLGDAFDLPDIQGGLVTTVRRLQTEPAQVKALLRGTLRSLDYLVRHDEELIDYLQREFHLAREVAAGSYAIVRQVLNPRGDIDAATLQAAVAQMKEDAGITDDVPLEQLVDLAPLRAVQAELNLEP